MQFKTPGITGHNRKLDIQDSDWKLSLPNWEGAGEEEEGERKGRETGLYCNSEKKNPVATKSCSQGDNNIDL